MKNSKHQDGLYEELRERYKPDEIKVLFVGESRPNSGKFFYKKDSILYSAMHEAFGHPNEFLDLLRANGFYLDDLIPYPVNRFKEDERECARRQHQVRLASRLSVYHPTYIITVMKRIKSHVDCAIQTAGIEFSHHYCLPFPWNDRFRAQFVHELKSILAEKKLITTNA